MGLFNSKKDQNKYSAQGTWPYPVDKVTQAIRIGIPGFVITGFNQWNNTFSLSAFPDYDAKITLYPQGSGSTSVHAEVSMHIGSMKFCGINLEAMANKDKVQKIMDAIIANLQRIYI